MHKLAFKLLESAMTTTPILELPDFTNQFILQTDASRYWIGAVLLQNDCSISYFSNSFIQNFKILRLIYEDYMQLQR